MKVIAVMGSPRKGGRSDAVCERVLQGARDGGHEVVVYRVNDMNLRGCQGCGYCKDNNHDCILATDLKPYWKDLHEAGVLVLSAPNYCSRICGPMITYMNRHCCLIGRNENGGFVRVHPGIKLIGVFSQGAPRYEKACEAGKNL